jgi:hypothetical protein
MLAIFTTLEAIGSAAASLITNYPMEATSAIGFAVALTYGCMALSIARLVLKGAR